MTTRAMAYENGTSRQPPGMAPLANPAAGTDAMIAGAMYFVTEAPTLPAPSTPSANPAAPAATRRSSGDADAEALPAKPARKAYSSRAEYDVVCETSRRGTAVNSSIATKTRRPTNRSAARPAAGATARR
jgi:hypothetical protein